MATVKNYSSYSSRPSDTTVVTKDRYKITASAQAWVSVRYAERSKAIAELVESTMDALVEGNLVDFGTGVTARLALIDDKAHGLFHKNENLLAIDINKINMAHPVMSRPDLIGGFSMIETICHELVHAEQYHQNRLVQVGLNSTRTAYVYSYRGRNETQSRMVNRVPKLTYDQYRALPWEAEAFNRQVSLAQIVTNMKPELKNTIRTINDLYIQEISSRR